MFDERRMQVLCATVVDYVTSGEPVGSEASVGRYRLGVSPAIVYDDMVMLEEEGYVAQPHIGARRIPTDKGYQLFVDRLATIKPSSTAERRAVSALMADALDVDDLIIHTVCLLAQLTHQVAVVQYPLVQRNIIAHTGLMQLTPK